MKKMKCCEYGWSNFLTNHSQSIEFCVNGNAKKCRESKSRILNRNESSSVISGPLVTRNKIITIFTLKFAKLTIEADILTIEQHTLDTNAGKQLS
jgi:hypothetical protein